MPGKPKGGGLLRGGGRGCRQAPNSSDLKTKQAFKMPSLMKSECWERWEFSLGKTAESRDQKLRREMGPEPPLLLPGSLGVGFGQALRGGASRFGRACCLDPVCAENGAALGTGLRWPWTSLKCPKGRVGPGHPQRCLHGFGLCLYLQVHACALACLRVFTFVCHVCAYRLDLLAVLFPQVLVTADAPPQAHVGFYFCTCLFLHVVL